MKPCCASQHTIYISRAIARSSHLPLLDERADLVRGMSMKLERQLLPGYPRSADASCGSSGPRPCSDRRGWPRRCALQVIGRHAHTGRATRVFPTLRTWKADGALISYQSFLEKASTCFLPLPFLPLERRLFFPTACIPTQNTRNQYAIKRPCHPHAPSQPSQSRTCRDTQQQTRVHMWSTRTAQNVVPELIRELICAQEIRTAPTASSSAAIE